MSVMSEFQHTVLFPKFSPNVLAVLQLEPSSSAPGLGTRYSNRYSVLIYAFAWPKRRYFELRATVSLAVTVSHQVYLVTPISNSSGCHYQSEHRPYMACFAKMNKSRYYS
jgi:hypothetical protein